MAFENNVAYSDLVEMTLISESKLINIANKEFEGDLEFRGSIKIKNYGVGGTINDYNDIDGVGAAETLTGDTVTLTIDKAKSFNFGVSDVEQVKNGNDISIWASQTFKNMAYTIEQDLYNLKDSVNDSNEITSHSAETASIANVISWIEEMRVRLREENVFGPYVLTVSPKFASLLRQNNLLNLAQATLSDKMGPQDVVKYGEDIVVLETSLVASTGEAEMLLCTYDYLNLAMGLDKVMFYVPDNKVSDHVKGLVVYGTGVFNNIKGCTLNYSN